MTSPQPQNQWSSQQSTPPQGFPASAQHAQQPQPTAVAFQRPPSPPRRSLVLGLVLALVMVLGGGGTWFALSQANSVAEGADTPTEATQNLADSLTDGDVVGMLSTLEPAEAALFTNPVGEMTDEFKRLGVLDPGADPEAFEGLQVKSANLTFDEAGTQPVNDHVAITTLTGGTLSVTADINKMPLSQDFVAAARENGNLDEPRRTETIDIAEQVRRTGEPIRIAAVNVGGSWYPSLFYTAADNALREDGESWPKKSIAAAGAQSPNEALRQLAQAALDADPRRVIELLPPDEMAAVHDAGPTVIDALGADLEPSGATITKLETETSPRQGGTKATLVSLEAQGADGERFSLTKNGSCYEVVIEGAAQRICADQLGDVINSWTMSLLPPDVERALRNLGNGLLSQGFGVVTTEFAGQHYVSPVRTFTEQGLATLRSLQPGDIEALMGLD